MVLTASALLWVKPEFSDVLGDLASQKVVVGLLLLIVSYTIGMIIASWSSAGSAHYIRNKRAREAGQLGDSRFWYWPILCLHWIRDPKPNQQAYLSIVKTNIRITEDLQKFGGLQGQSMAVSPWELLETYRVIMSGRIGCEGSPIVAEAESIHRRLIFTLGVSLALLILAVESTSRLIIFAISEATIWDPKLPEISWPLLLALLVIPALGSIVLRLVAGHWWQYEIFLTRGITVIYE